MKRADEILPNDEGPIQNGIAFSASDELPVPIAQILDPFATPARFLPWLAAHNGVRLWWSDWPEERKRRIIDDWPRLASLIGTRAAAVAFLAYVDAEVVAKRSYPARFPVGRMAAGRSTPIRHPAHTAQFLIKVRLRAHPRAICVGRTAVGRGAVLGVDREPLRRARAALVASKAPGSEYSASFAHRSPITVDDGFDLDAGLAFGDFMDRASL